MPSTTGQSEMPSTLRRSPKKAQRTWQETHDSAVRSYGEGERAHRTAFSALKHSYEKVGDHWEAKEARGPSDEQAARTAPRSSRPAASPGGVDGAASKAHLYRRARELEIPGRSRMDREELLSALQRENRRQTARARAEGR